MEKLSKSIQKVQAQQELTKSLPEQSLVKNNDCYELSAYANGKQTEEGMNNAFARLEAAFPAFKDKDSFWAILTSRVTELGLSDERLMDAVNHVIDNCKYPTPTIANFFSVDKKTKLYT